MKKDFNVCYIRLPELYRDYFRTKFGNPAIFSPSSEMQFLLRTQLMNNPMLGKQTYKTAMSYSDKAFNYTSKGQAVDAEICMPSQAERDEFVAVLIPEEVTRYNGTMQTSDTWQITDHGARRLRELVKEDFWRELSRFSEECNYRARISGEKVTREEIVSDFITMYNVPMTSYENFLRYETRHRASAASSIEKKRNALEMQTGNKFMYT